MDDRTDTRWERLKEIVPKLLGLDPAGRAGILDEACGGDVKLRAQVTQLLDNHGSALEFFHPFPELLAVASGRLDPARTFSDGEVVSNRFRIVGLLGEGGMGEVYEAEDLVLQDERVALKTLRATLAADEGAIERLSRELRIARRITHPNVCRVHDVYQHQTTLGARVVFFTMELLKGDTLADRLRDGRIPAADVLPLLRQMAAAVDAAHAANVAHGDFKPGNVMLVASRSGADRVVVTDFGLARWLPVGSALLSTAVNSKKWGTPAYMAPEQLFGGGVTRATDIYALGVVFYEMVTGHQPFTAEFPLLLALTKLRHAPRLPREYAHDLDPGWQTVILRCLDVKPENRFELAIDIIKALERAPRKTTRWIAGAAALACAGVIATPPIREKVVEKSTSLSSAVSQYVGGVRTLALLPFAQENRTLEGGAFSLGLTAAVTEELGRWSDYERRLNIVPATALIDTGVDTPARLHQTLGVDLIITGRLEVVNDRTRITVVLNGMSRDGMAVKDTRTLEIGPDDREPLESKVTAAIARLVRMSPPSVAPRRLLEGGARPVEAEMSYLMGRGFLLQGPGSLTSAIGAFLDAIQKNERLAVAYAGASEAYLNNYDAAKNADSLKNAQIKIDEAIALDPLDPRSHVIRGRVYLTTSQHGRAIVEFQRAIDLDPNASDAQNYLAAAYEADGAMEMAENQYRKAIALHPRYWSGYEDLGIFLYKHGRYHDAEQNFVVGSGYAPTNRRALLNLAAVYEIQERFTAAEAELVKGLKLSPDPLLYNNLGWIYIQEGKFEDAVNAMTEAVKLPRANSVVWSGLARAYRWSGRHEEEEKLAYTTALKRADEEVRTNPLNADTRANRAYLLAETHHEREALGEISATLGIENARGNVTVLFRSGLIHELVGDRKGALEALEQAARGGYPRGRIERDPDLKELRNDPGYRHVLGVAGRGSN